MRRLGPARYQLIRDTGGYQQQQRQHPDHASHFQPPLSDDLASYLASLAAPRPSLRTAGGRRTAGRRAIHLAGQPACLAGRMGAVRAGAGGGPCRRSAGAGGIWHRRGPRFPYRGNDPLAGHPGRPASDDMESADGAADGIPLGQRAWRTAKRRGSVVAAGSGRLCPRRPLPAPALPQAVQRPGRLERRADRSGWTVQFTDGAFRMGAVADRSLFRLSHVPGL